MGGILHATDFSEASAPAFEHALALALDLRLDLTLLHAGAEEGRDVPWERFPHVRETLARWGRGGDGEEAFRRSHGIGVKKLAVKARDAAAAILEADEARTPALIVLSKRAAAGWLSSSVSAQVARRAGAAVLVVPEGARGFVDGATGEVRLRRVLAGVDRRPDPTAALREARWLGKRRQGTPAAVVEFFHAGAPEGMPALPDALFPEAAVERVVSAGAPEEALPARAEATGADLIVLATEGRRGLGDRLRGSTTDRVLAAARVPVLAIPA